ncbi:MAG: hypothetical protein PHX30_05000 [Candidatus Pacebacteria bacterium]|nr:hypothetical protein [Candidatus Paceibacterota bacterium]
MFIFCFIFILLLTYIVGALLYTRDNYLPQQTGESIDPDEYFKSCKLLEAKCLDIGCKYYSRCGDGNYDSCRIYDCGDTLGVFTENVKGKQDANWQAKPDLAAVAAKKEACAGTMEVLSQECVGGKEQIKVKIVTEGECKIGGFAVIYEGIGTEPNSFEALENSIYSITALSCGTVSRIVPATENGISLEF